MRSRSGLAILGLAVVAAVAIAAAGAWLGSGQPPAPGPSESLDFADLTPAEVAVLSKLDDDSRRLALLVASDEPVVARFATGTEDRMKAVMARAREAGLDPVRDGEERPTVQVLGSRTTVLAIAAMPQVGRVTLEEDFRADRPIAHPLERPIDVPQPASPFAAGGLPLGNATLAELGPHRAPMLAALPDVVLSIDGQPYERIEWTGSCDPGECYVSLSGRTAGSTMSDLWNVHGSPATGWIGLASPNDPPMLVSVPRRLAREAERIARTDRAAGPAIAQRDIVGLVRWDPGAPGVISIAYITGCAFNGDVEFGRQLAEDGCLPDLFVRVDVGGGRVLETREGPGAVPFGPSG